MSYLERWWRDASDQRKESFAKLVKDGQLEIVGGGWVMNDEVFFLPVYRALYGCKFQMFTDVIQHMNHLLHFLISCMWST